MLEVTGDLWDFHRKGFWVCITTNGATNRYGACVMGRGTALQAARLYPELPYLLGDALRIDGNHAVVFPVYKIITLPVKHTWSEPADIMLIQRSCQELAIIQPQLDDPHKCVYLPRPGCGNGGLSWATVRPVITGLLDRHFTVVEFNG